MTKRIVRRSRPAEASPHTESTKPAAAARRTVRRAVKAFTTEPVQRNDKPVTKKPEPKIVTIASFGTLNKVTQTGHYPVVDKCQDGPPNLAGVKDLQEVKDLLDRYRHPGPGLYPNRWSWEQQILHVVNHYLREAQAK